MRADLRERLEFLADELVREEAVGLVEVSAHLVMNLESWSQPVQVRFEEKADAPGLYEMIVREVTGSGDPWFACRNCRAAINQETCPECGTIHPPELMPKRREGAE